MRTVSNIGLQKLNSDMIFKTIDIKKTNPYGSPFSIIRNQSVKTLFTHNQKRRFLHKCVSKVQINFQMGLPSKPFLLAYYHPLGGNA